MILYDVQCTPPMAYKVCHDYFEDIDLNDEEVLRLKDIVLLYYIASND